MPKSKTTRRWLIAMQVVISGALLIYLFGIIPFESLHQAALDADPLFLLIGTGGMLAVHWLASVQMTVTLALQNIFIRVHRVLRVNLISMFYSLFLPALIGGGGVRWYHFSRLSNSPAESLAAIVFNRAYDTLLMVFFGIVALIASFQTSMEMDTAVLLVTLLVFTVATYLVLFDRRIHALCERAIGRTPLPAVIVDKVTIFLDSLSRFDNVGTGIHMKLFALGLLRQTMGVALLMLFVIALDIDVSVLTIAWIRSLVTILALLPFSIAGLGIREATFVVTLGQFGVPSEQAFLLSLLLFARTVVYGLIGGVLEGVRVFLKSDSV